MRVVEDTLGRTRFTAERYEWSMLALVLGALGICVAALTTG